MAKRGTRGSKGRNRRRKNRKVSDIDRSVDIIAEENTARQHKDLVEDLSSARDGAHDKDNDKFYIDFFQTVRDTVNPYAMYNRLRDTSSVHRLNNDLWVISRYDDVQFALKNYQLFSSAGCDNLLNPPWLSKDCKRSSFIAFEDPPVHTKHRSLISRTFATRVINEHRPYIVAQAAELVRQTTKATSIDFIAGFSAPYVAAVLNSFMGIEDISDIDRTRRWIEAMELSFTDDVSEKNAETIQRSINKQRAVFQQLIQDRRANPKNDFVTELLHNKVDGVELSAEHEVTSIIELMYKSGYQSTVQTLAIAIKQLVQRPELLTILTQSPERIASFISEILRLYSPFPFVARKAKKSIQLQGKTIAAGSMVFLSLAAANRDPNHFVSPDELDLNRPQRGIPFGYGPHICIGDALARLMLNEAISQLLPYIETMSCPDDSELNWVNRWSFRKLLALPIATR